MICANSTTAFRSDAELIAETLQGSPDSFGLLVLRYQDRLYSAVAHAIGNADDAYDVVQEALLQAFRRLETFRNSSAFYTWLYRIAFNMAATHRRRRHFAVSIEQARTDHGDELVGAELAPEERCEHTERCQLVRGAIASLPADLRAVLVLRELEGLRYENIAEILDVPVGTIRSRLHRARIQLRAILQTSVGHEPPACGQRLGLHRRQRPVPCDVYK